MGDIGFDDSFRFMALREVVSVKSSVAIVASSCAGSSSFVVGDVGCPCSPEITGSITIDAGRAGSFGA